MVLTHQILGVQLKKSVVSLNPPWIRIFTGEKVTLTCHGNNPLQNSSTKWIHSGSNSNVTTSHLDIVSATIQNSGKYISPNQGCYKSDPVHLEVMEEWLILQTSADVVMEGGSFLIRCHGWKNWDIYMVTYYKDGLGLTYYYDGLNTFIRNDTFNDSDTFHCWGRLHGLHFDSEKVRITVIKDWKCKHDWLQFIILLVVILFAVDMNSLVSTQKQLTSVLKIQKTGKHNKP
nr:LOW QUALITY PROTEIN: high affinity immunoglobulin epsilon receptor subunit alpha-like [Peromyscus maniculatus bairdii]